MKRLIVLFSALLVLSVVPAYAKENPSSEKQALKMERKELLAEKKASDSALRADLKTNLLKIRDEKKKEIVEKLGEKVIKINSTRVDHFENILDKLKEILARIDSKSSDLKSSGKDTTELDAAIAKASADLDLASSIVSSQSAKTYTINISTSSALRRDTGKLISGMQSDLRTTMSIVNTAKKSVHTALMVLKRSFGGSLPKTATPSGTPTGAPSLTPTASPSATPAI